MQHVIDQSVFHTGRISADGSLTNSPLHRHLIRAASRTITSLTGLPASASDERERERERRPTAVRTVRADVRRTVRRVRACVCACPLVVFPRELQIICSTDESRVDVAGARWSLAMWTDRQTDRRTVDA